MNNVINKNCNCTRRESGIYNETLGEKLISFFCVIIAFFENEAVAAFCRMTGVALLAVGSFFYASAVMSAELSAVGVLFYGALLVCAAAVVFGTGTLRKD